MKKILVLFITLFIFNMNANAASLCSYKEQTELNKKASNVKASYEIIKEDYHKDGFYYQEKYMKVTILNITDDIYIEVNNDNNDEIKTFNVSNANDGVVTFIWDDINDVTNFTIKVYSSSNTNCPDETYKTLYLTLPRYNEYSKYGACQDAKDFYLCQEFVVFPEVTQKSFFEQLNKYKDKKIDEKGEILEEEDDNENILDKIVDYFIDYKYYIFGGVIILVLLMFIIRMIKTKKQRDLGL